MTQKNTNKPDRQQNLLAKLIDDSCSSLPKEERTIDRVSVEALVWNLFKGTVKGTTTEKYDFSVVDVRFIINAKLQSEKK